MHLFWLRINWFYFIFIWHPWVQGCLSSQFKSFYPKAVSAFNLHNFFSFSPTGQFLASGSGDTTVRFWDLTTETPQYECKAHNQWILAIAWAPNGLKLASGDKSGLVCLWDPKTGKQVCFNITGNN